MPTETGRVIKRKRVNLPGGSTVDVPVITQITFLDVVEQGQEYEFHIENSGAANRDVHVASIPGGGAATDESGGGGDSDLKVERIDVWRVLDIVERAQESFIHLDNKTIKEPPDAPPYFTTHEKTHIVKYINTPDDGNWIKSELIDRFKVLDVVEQGQEKEYFLFNPPDNTGISGLTLDTDSDGNPTVAVDPGLPDVSDSNNGVDPPFRTDPFQNIVDFSSPILAVVTWYYRRDNDINNPPDIAPIHPVEFRDLALSLAPGSPTKPANFSVTGAPTMPSIPVGAGTTYVNWINSPDGGPPDAVFTGTASVSGTVAIGTGPSPGFTTGTTSITASMSGISGSMSGTPWTLHGLSITFAQCQGPVTSPPLTVFGTIYPDWIIAAAVFKPT